MWWLLEHIHYQVNTPHIRRLFRGKTAPAHWKWRQDAKLHPTIWNYNICLYICKFKYLIEHRLRWGLQKNTFAFSIQAANQSDQNLDKNKLYFAFINNKYMQCVSTGTFYLRRNIDNKKNEYCFGKRWHNCTLLVGSFSKGMFVCQIEWCLASPWSWSSLSVFHTWLWVFP